MNSILFLSAVAISWMLHSCESGASWSIHKVGEVNRAQFPDEFDESWLPASGNWVAVTEYWMIEFKKHGLDFKTDEEWDLIIVNGYEVDVAQSTSVNLYALNPEEFSAKYYIYKYPSKFHAKMGVGSQNSLRNLPLSKTSS